MNDNNVQITSTGIRNSLKKYNALKSICEYIWNGFDAKATQINVEIMRNELDSISYIKISDNGYGIDNELLNDKFRPFFQSEKIYDPNIKQSDVHGKNGVGRLTFFTFASLATWTTVYSQENKNYEYSITIDSNELKTESILKLMITDIFCLRPQVILCLLREYLTNLFQNHYDQPPIKSA